jgi:Flp pilus assembly protein TadD
MNRKQRRAATKLGRKPGDPRNPVYHSNLGVALAGQGKLKEAITAYRQAIGIKSDYAEVHSNLGSALKDQGRRQLPPIGRRSASNPTLPRLTPIWPIA